MLKKFGKILCALALLAVLALPLSSCNTMQGLGQDAKAAGEALSGAAQKSKGY